MSALYRKDDEIVESPGENPHASIDEKDISPPSIGHSKDMEVANIVKLRKTKHSDAFTILAAGSALISDGYQNNVQTMLNTLFAKRYGSKIYSSAISTRLSNSLLVGCVLGQVIVGLMCDRIGRKSAILTSTLLLAVGSIFATAAVPVNGDVSRLWWWLTVSFQSFSSCSVLLTDRLLSHKHFILSKDCTWSHWNWSRRRISRFIYFCIRSCQRTIWTQKEINDFHSLYQSCFIARWSTCRKFFPDRFEHLQLWQFNFFI